MSAGLAPLSIYRPRGQTKLNTGRHGPGTESIYSGGGPLSVPGKRDIQITFPQVAAIFQPGLGSSFTMHGL